MAVARRTLIFLFMAGSAAVSGSVREQPGLEQIVETGPDIWGEMVLRPASDPTYDSVESFLPPLRYVNADFRHYPIVLGLPGSTRKARLISNGSAVNARAGARSWNELGTPVTFRVGPDEFRFGSLLERLRGPVYERGYLPMVQVQYRHGEAVYQLEAFAPAGKDWAEGTVFVQFTLAEGALGNIAAQPEGGPFQVGDRQIRDDQGRVVLEWAGPWKWTRQRLSAGFKTKQRLSLCIHTVAANPGGMSFSEAVYAQERENTVAFWEALLADGMQLSVPEPRVQAAWKALVIGTCSLINSNRIHYSSGNQYDKLYEAEGSDAARALLWFGQIGRGRELIPPLLDFTRKGLEFHQAGHKLQLLTTYLALTGDADFIRAQEPRWGKELARLRGGRTVENGLFPREQYCGDVATPVFSLNSNAKGWRALRDFAAVLEALGQSVTAAQVRTEAADFRAKIWAAVAQSERRDIQPPFIPIALLGEEQPYPLITETKIGSYWNLMIHYVLASGVFPAGSRQETAIVDYVRQRGGLCLGLVRSRPNPTFWTGLNSLNPLYGFGYYQTVLRRDEPEQALLSFYAMLAHGFTRDTWIAGEGSSLRAIDGNGRLLYCPPNSAGNAFALSMLRWLLVQEWDTDDDGILETLHLLKATPREWLEEGKRIALGNAPTAFGPVSVSVTSALSEGQVRFEVELPERRNLRRCVLRLRMPEEVRMKGATVNGAAVRIVTPESLELPTTERVIKGVATVQRRRGNE